MYIAVDDTDSRVGMCTTYILTEIIDRSDLDLIGYPNLVRLNPAIRHKTRGNGALSANLGQGTGSPTIIGEFQGRKLLSYPSGGNFKEDGVLMKLAREVVEELAELHEPDTNPGIVVSEKKFDPSFYLKAVKEELSIPEAEKFIKNQGGSYSKFKIGRGIIGAAAAISWPGTRYTFEFMSYKYPAGYVLEKSRKISVSEMADSVEGTFNNIDSANHYAAIFPKERTPVVLGVRGTEADKLLEKVPEILMRNEITHDRYLIYRTNQATDDHIIEDPVEIHDNRSYSIEGTVNSEIQSITGGHLFSSIILDGKEIQIAAFEPTKEFRKVFAKLMPGDVIRVYGTLADGCLNVEKMSVKCISAAYRRNPPACPECGAGMHSRGRMDYRCTNCGARSNIPSYRREQRYLELGDYDVPVIARRHLSRPFDLQQLGSDILVQEDLT